MAGELHQLKNSNNIIIACVLKNLIDYHRNRLWPTAVDAGYYHNHVYKFTITWHMYSHTKSREGKKCTLHLYTKSRTILNSAKSLVDHLPEARTDH